MNTEYREFCDVSIITLAAILIIIRHQLVKCGILSNCDEF